MLTTTLCALLSVRIRAEKLSKSPILLQQLLVGAHLRDFPIRHDQNCIRLREIVDGMSHQNPRLNSKTQREKVLTAEVSNTTAQLLLLLRLSSNYRQARKTFKEK